MQYHDVSLLYKYYTQCHAGLYIIASELVAVYKVKIIITAGSSEHALLVCVMLANAGSD